MLLGRRPLEAMSDVSTSSGYTPSPGSADPVVVPTWLLILIAVFVLTPCLTLLIVAIKACLPMSTKPSKRQVQSDIKVTAQDKLEPRLDTPKEGMEEESSRPTGKGNTSRDHTEEASRNDPEPTAEVRKDTCTANINRATERHLARDVWPVQFPADDGMSVRSIKPLAGSDSLEITLPVCVESVDGNQRCQSSDKKSRHKAPKKTRRFRNGKLYKHCVLKPHLRKIDGRLVMAGAPYLWSIMAALPVGMASHVRPADPRSKVKIPLIRKLKSSHL